LAATPRSDAGNRGRNVRPRLRPLHRRARNGGQGRLRRSEMDPPVRALRHFPLPLSGSSPARHGVAGASPLLGRSDAGEPLALRRERVRPALHAWLAMTLERVLTPLLRLVARRRPLAFRATEFDLIAERSDLGAITCGSESFIFQTSDRIIGRILWRE